MGKQSLELAGKTYTVFGRVAPLRKIELEHLLDALGARRPYGSPRVDLAIVGEGAPERDLQFAREMADTVLSFSSFRQELAASVGGCNEWIALLRDMLYGRPTSQRWWAICAALELLPADVLEPVVDYVEGAIEDWPDVIRERNRWVGKPTEKRRDPRGRLVRWLRRPRKVGSIRRGIDMNGIVGCNLDRPDDQSFRDLGAAPSFRPRYLSVGDGVGAWTPFLEAPSASRIEELELFNCRFGPKDVAALASGSLNLRSLSIVDDDMDPLLPSALAAGTWSQLERLELRQRFGPDLSATPLAEAMGRGTLPNLAQLELDGFDVDSAAAEALAAPLAALPDDPLDRGLSSTGFDRAALNAMLETVLGSKKY